MKNYRKTWAAAFLAAAVFHSGAVSAQEIERGNPFTAPPSWAEEQARLDERTRIIIREMEPEMKNDIMKRVNESQASLEIKLRKRIDLVAQSIATAAQAAAQPAAGAGGAAETPAEGAEPKAATIPEGAKFISCVNKEALYRDSNDILFKVPKDDPQSVSRCAD